MADTSLGQSPSTQHLVSPPAQAGMFVVLTVDEGGEDTVRDLLGDAGMLTRSVAFGFPAGGLSLVVGIGAELWDRLYDTPRPAHLHTFEAIEGAEHTAVSTPGDLLLHLRAERMDLCFALAQRITDRLTGVATVVDEVHGFRYFNVRDLLGFVDGTENPEGDDAVDAILIGDEDPAHAGGSYVIVQKYLHELTAWERLSTEEQERVIGRRKLTDIELPEDEKPSNSHIALNDIQDEEGNDREILRDNMPFGSLQSGELGTYFIGYAKDPDVTETMLRNMFIGDPPGNHDRILDFSTAVTGSLYYVPTRAELEDGPTA